MDKFENGVLGKGTPVLDAALKVTGQLNYVDDMKYFDSHADTLTEIQKTGETLAENTCDLDLRRVDGFAGAYGQVFALWKDRQLLRESPETEFRRLYNRAASLLGGQSGRVRLCRTSRDLQSALAEGTVAALLSMTVRSAPKLVS